MKPGIHLMHKAAGVTSFSLVQQWLEAVRALKGERTPRICHGGTLDPFATGLLLMLVEPATRLFDYLHDVPKVYEATVRWGVETDNGDPLGRIVSQGDAAGLSIRQLDDALQTFVGWQEQIPPATSAKRIDGERAYLRVQRGEAVVMPPVRVYLHEALWLEHDFPRQSRLRVTVRGGYYVRALARDLGRLAGCGAHLAELRRTAIGPWIDPGPDRCVELTGRAILPWATTRVLSDQEVGELRQRRPIPAGNLLPPDWPLPPAFDNPRTPVRGFHLERFCFLLRPEDGRLTLLAPLRGGM
jgi:tRNA pseudouridine55 synthase